MTNVKPKAEPIPKFPVVWVKPTLEIIQFSTLLCLDTIGSLTLNDLVDAIYYYFRGNRFESEVVFLDVPSSGLERSVERGTIIEKVDNTVPITLEKKVSDKRQQQRDAKEAAELAAEGSKIPNDPHHYVVRLIKNKSKTYVVAPNQMRRPRQLLSKITIKGYIKDVATKENRASSIWKVKVNSFHLILGLSC